MSLPQPHPMLAHLPAYIPGKRPAPDAKLIKLSSNESAYPPFEPVQAAIVAAAGQVHRYPDLNTTDLTAALAGFLRTTPDQVLVGPGSVAVLGHLLQSFAAGGDVVYAWRSFEAYPILTQLAGATAKPIPLTSTFAHDLPAMLAAISPQTKVMIVCAPNNPTGPTVTHAEFADFLAAVPSQVLVVLDEAYIEFAAPGARVQVAELLAQYRNLVVVRTFSKAYGLAGLRVGYAWGDGEVLAAVRKVLTPFGVSNVAQAAGIAALTCQTELSERAAEVIAERARLHAAVTELGFTVPESAGNFIFLAAKDAAGTQSYFESAALNSALADQGIIGRAFPEGIRLTVGTPPENDHLLQALASLASTYLIALA